MKILVKVTLLSLLFFLFSCSSKKTEHKVTTTETIQTEPSSTAGQATQVSNTPTKKTTVVKEEVKEETEDSGGDFGILGTTVSVIGEIIALPFRLVAGIIDFIF